MNNQKAQSNSRWERGKKAVISKWRSWNEAFVFVLLEWAPTPLGNFLRRLIYRTLFVQLGKSACIRSGVQFVGASRIKLGDMVSIHRGVRIRSLNQNSTVSLGDRVTVDMGVDIKSNRGRIELGKRSYLGPYTCLSGGDIKIGNNVLIASH